MSIQQIVYEKIARLPDDKQREVLDFVEFLELKIASSAENDISCYTLAQRWAGCIEDGANDLSFNKKYMEGYGQ
jgi:hypothetical protein